MNAKPEHDTNQAAVVRPSEQIKGELSEDALLLIRETMKMVAYYRRLMERYELDALTGLPGSTKFHDFIEGIESRAYSIGIVFFDVNDLKLTNDTLGHQAGDLLIQKAAESIQLVFNDQAYVFRVGGDEFVALALNCEEEVIVGLLETWRDKLRELNAHNDGIHCSISAGYAYGTGSYSASDILKKADEQMYINKTEMKNSRRNQI